MATKKTAKVNKMDGFSADVRQEKLDALKQLIPEAFADGKIDVQRLRKIVGEDVPTEDERYRLEWSGKAEVFDEIAERSSCTLTLDEKRSSKDWKDSNNIFIEGENLEVLRTLQKAYSGGVKMIYIDPPYNTGNDFVYNDDFRETEEEYCEAECNVGENGLLRKAYKLNSRDGGRFHSNWLSMIYPRLYLSKNLLREDGVIFVSIDDNEAHNLRMVMNEIFGEENFMAQLIWKSRASEDTRSLTGISTDHEYILVYRKSELATLRGVERDLTKFSNPDNDTRGPWRSADMTGLLSADQRPNCHYDLKNPETGIVYECPPKGWRFDKTTMAKKIAENRVLWPKNEDGRPRHKLYLEEISNKYKNISSIILKPNTVDGTRELNSLITSGVFQFPKPSTLVELLVSQNSEEDDIVLDFFSGSAPTAHAVMKQNAEDGGGRQYICVQLPEETPDGSEARKAGYKKISDIAIDRIKKASVKIKKDYPKFKSDLGVRVYKETESHFPQWHSQVFKSDKDLEQAIIDYSKAVPSGTAFDRATEVLLKLGYPLTTEITEKDGYMLAAGEVALVLDTKFQSKNLQKVLDATPKTVIVLEKLFKKDEDKINFALRCKEAKVIFQTV